MNYTVVLSGDFVRALNIVAREQALIPEETVQLLVDRGLQHVVKQLRLRHEQKILQVFAQAQPTDTKMAMDIEIGKIPDIAKGK